MNKDMQYNKRLASVSDATRYFFKSFFYMSKMIERDRKIVDEKFVERIMLTVTQVNGCKICSQAHAKRAFEVGLTKEEISKMLSDEKDVVSLNESVGVLFATDYADERGRPNQNAINRLYQTYGRRNGKAIIGACAMIMMGNTLGIAFDTFKKRLKGIKTGSSIFRELGIFMIFIVMLPIEILTFVLGFIINC